MYKPKANTHLRMLDVLAFIVGALSFAHVQVIGELYLSEIALALLLLLLWRKKSALLRDAWVKRIIFVGFLWFMSQVITDLIRATPVSDLLRGWALIVVFLADFAALYMLLSQNIRRIMIYVLGVALGGLVQPFLQPSPYFAAYPWQYGFGTPSILLTLTVISFFCGNRLSKIRAWVVPLTVLGLLSFYLGSRTLGAFTILTAFLIWFRSQKLGKGLVVRLSIGKIALVGIILLTVIFGLSKSYGYAAEQGWFGSLASYKYKMQSGGALGIIVGGRADVIPGLYAVLDSPIIGHGSWAQDSKYRLYFYKLLDLGYTDKDLVAFLKATVESSDLIPTHSHILQAWVWAGVVGAIFWAVIFWLVLKSIILNYRFPTPLFVLVIFLGLQSVWDILFSPFGAFMRLIWAMRLTIFIVSLFLVKAQASAEGNV